VLWPTDRAVIIFVRTVDGVKRVVEGLRKKKVADDHIAQLTGTIRGKERDALVEHPVFKRFLPNPGTTIAGAVYLVCTSAGEVGVNISADDLVCDLAPFDSMAQRIGRVNRFGRRTGDDGSTVAVVQRRRARACGPTRARRPA
jgi:CRISPR-associated endonuclease/helicase Cas3